MNHQLNRRAVIVNDPRMKREKDKIAISANILLVSSITQATIVTGIFWNEIMLLYKSFGPLNPFGIMSEAVLEKKGPFSLIPIDDKRFTRFLIAGVLTSAWYFCGRFVGMIFTIVARIHFQIGMNLDDRAFVNILNRWFYKWIKLAVLMEFGWVMTALILFKSPYFLTVCIVVAVCVLSMGWLIFRVYHTKRLLAVIHQELIIQ